MRINSEGLRNRERSIAKPNDTFRIAILGDSYAEGVQLDIDKLFWKVMESELQACGYSRKSQIEAINFGASGYGTARELLMLIKKVWKYSPDLVILAFLTGNDIRDNSKELNRIDYIPYFDLNKEAELILDDSYLESSSYRARAGLAVRIMYSIGNELRILQLANVFRHAWQHGANNNDGKTRFGELGLDSSVYLPPVDQVWLDAWAVTEAILLRLNKEIGEMCSEFILVTLSNGIQVHPNVISRMKFMEKLNIDHLFYPENRRIRTTS